MAGVVAHRHSAKTHLILVNYLAWLTLFSDDNFERARGVGLQFYLMRGTLCHAFHVRIHVLCHLLVVTQIYLFIYF